MMAMMKRLMILILLVPALGVRALTLREGRHYSVSYEKQHLLYNRGGDVSVIDAELEIPEVLDGVPIGPLQQYISKELFGRPADDVHAAYQGWLDSFGSPVTARFEEIPDDERFCYADVLLQLLYYEPRCYVSFRMSLRVTPAKKSSRQARSLSRLFTYDMTTGKVLTEKELLKHSLFSEESDGTNRFSTYLLNHSTTDFSITGLPGMVSFLGALAGRSMHFDTTWYYATDPVTSVSDKVDVPLGELDHLLSSTTRKLLKARPVESGAVESVRAFYAGGDSVYVVVDTMPRPAVDSIPMTVAFSRSVRVLPDEVRKDPRGSLVCRFVVEPDGSVSNIRVVRPSSPYFDRLVANFVRLMPRMRPGMLNGRPVRTLFTFPLSVRWQ